MLNFKRIMENIDAIRAGATKPSDEGLEWEIALEMTQGCGPEWYAFAYWTPADVHFVREIQRLPALNEEEAEKWLLNQEEMIAEEMIYAGNEYLLDHIEDDLDDSLDEEEEI